ncbi:MAG: 3-hydroxybutyryl-CoA dehydrogenase, partial [Actinobacteria bacterium]|nr:3-hydroxybutyryl-CoA dehydrogenase [Actinomycetota bacterium]
MSETNISKVGICGSGIMGSGLAEVAAKAGYTVIVRSRSAASAQAMITSIEKGLEKQVSREKITA